MAKGNDTRRPASDRVTVEGHRQLSPTNRQRKTNEDRTRAGTHNHKSQQERMSPDSYRDRGSSPGQEAKPHRVNERTFNVIVDSVPYIVKVLPFRFNGETRYEVSFNGSAEYVFTWDSSLGQLRAIDDEASTLPDNLEIAISEKLQSLQ